MVYICLYVVLIVVIVGVFCLKKFENINDIRLEWLVVISVGCIIVVWIVLNLVMRVVVWVVDCWVWVVVVVSYFRYGVIVVVIVVDDGLSYDLLIRFDVMELKEVVVEVNFIVSWF